MRRHAATIARRADRAHLVWSRASARRARRRAGDVAARGAEESRRSGDPRPAAGTPLDGAELDARTRELGERMRCPVCQGTVDRRLAERFGAGDDGAGARSARAGLHRRAGARLLRRAATASSCCSSRRRRASTWWCGCSRSPGWRPERCSSRLRLRGSRAAPRHARRKPAARARPPSGAQARGRDPSSTRYVERVRSEVGS